MLKPLDPERPGKFSSSLVAGLSMRSLLDSMAIRRVAREPLKALRARTGCTTSVGVLWGTEIVYVDRLQGSRQGQHAVDVGTEMGTCQPVHCTAAGKALLARLPAAEQKALIAKLQLTRRRAPKTIVTKTALRAELGGIVAMGGVAVKDEEFSAGRCAVAAVAVDSMGRSNAAVELVVPVEAHTRKELLEQLGPKVKTTLRAYLGRSRVARVESLDRPAAYPSDQEVPDGFDRLR